MSSVTGIDARAAAPPPSRALLTAVGAGGVVAVACSIALAAASDHVDLPAVQAALFVWIMVAYLSSGLVAWWRRPDSGFGRLLVVVGFGAGLSNLAWSNHPLPFTVGQACDLLPVALFLHVFLAFPTGRARSPLVPLAYAAATVPQVTVMLLGGFGPGNLLAVTDEPRAATVVHAAELLTLAALLVDSFALGLVSLAALLVMASSRVPASRWRSGSPWRSSVWHRPRS